MSHVAPWPWNLVYFIVLIVWFTRTSSAVHELWGWKLWLVWSAVAIVLLIIADPNGYKTSWGDWR